jgi:hypothetical protein
MVTLVAICHHTIATTFALPKKKKPQQNNKK